MTVTEKGWLHMARQHVRSIILVRHGRTAYNAIHRLQGRVDIPLDAVGRWQARQTAAALKELYVDGAAQPVRPLVVCSDLVRARATAEAFADALGESGVDVAVHPDARVRERSFGDWEGCAAADLQERYPEDYRLWVEHKGGEMKHGAEPKEAVGSRGVEAVLDWAGRGGEDTDLYVFSHGAWISQTLQTLLGLNRVDPMFASVLSVRNSHWVRLMPMDFADGSMRWCLSEYNHGPAVADTAEWDRER